MSREYLTALPQLVDCSIALESMEDTKCDKSKEVGKDQEPIQSNARSPHGKMTKKPRKHHIQESQDVSAFPAGDHKAVV